MMIQLSERKPGAKKVLKRVMQVVARSRFSIGDHYLTFPKSKRAKDQGGTIHFRRAAVRLRHPRPYWGNPPFGAQHILDRRSAKSTTHLMSADWIEFLDLINDILDDMDLHAHLKSRTLVARRGMARRVQYHHSWSSCGNWSFWVENPDPIHGSWTSQFPKGLYPFSRFDPRVLGTYRGIHKVLEPSES